MTFQPDIKTIARGIVFYLDKGGATLQQLVEFYDWQQHRVVSEEEILKVLDELKRKNFHSKSGNKYLLKKSLSVIVPRTKNGSISFAKKSWESFLQKTKILNTYRDRNDHH